ncbi:DUF4330 domain-containing protein [Paratissierella segnis]|jgi:hypothetical protein|uniref:DUF4330 domain-containing protein n=1 Tax=Paratissierella segnis TaxID=2763679 RepID=A0A926EQH9_9FIRM|nr:DUF4330 domain-containing protein [Paratissierella segnis]MBC8586931.1 DUF4330 domain-containing protein [Paratissierella segnis]
MIDKNGKLFGKISIIDLIIIILVILAGIFAVKKLGIFTPKGNVTDSTDKIQVVFYQEEVNSFTANNVKLGDPTSETLQNMSFGAVTDIQTEDSVSWGEDKDGKQVKSTKNGFNAVYITTETNGVIGPNGINIGGSNYYIGQFITLRVGTSIFYGRIYDAAKI